MTFEYILSRKKENIEFNHFAGRSLLQKVILFFYRIFRMGGVLQIAGFMLIAII